jgi:hypothetical protein
MRMILEDPEACRSPQETLVPLSERKTDSKRYLCKLRWSSPQLILKK